MKNLALIGLAVLVVFAFACSTAPDANLMKCAGCKMDCPKDKVCPKDGMCAHCDKCTAKCEGCKKDVKCMDLCPKCKKCCTVCDKCAK